ncbi:MAG: NAD(P)-dependent oxidoreductase [Ilumatobacteraceae bacterium]|nr:NAD(P)-dependent oxidoreductase [Ilumatobacteraceae bacterium]
MGATGYIGGRLAPQLALEGHEVRCLTRRPDHLAEIDWASSVEICEGDALDPASLEAAMVDIDVVYYLVHSIGTGSTFEETDRQAARNTAEAAAGAGLARIIYLGGLVPTSDDVSPHLASRAEVGQIFLDGAVPAVVLQAGVILGSGSASFEMLRYLTERLPAMVTPRWVSSLVQPIAVRDVLSYLAGALDLEPGTDRRFDIAGPDILSYREMMQRYASVAGLKRRIIIPVPVLTPWLSSQWINVVTPVPKAIAQPLVESLRNDAVAHEHDIEALIPLDLCPFDEAVRLALERIRLADVVTRWSGASWPGAPSNPMPTDPDWSGGTAYRDDRDLPVDVPPQDLWRAIEGIGGDHGWYSFPLAWAVRGLLDRAVGGVGLRRGRRHPDRLVLGDAVDFWRVEALERGRLLRLRAEMRLPGEAWLEFSITDEGDKTVLHQHALFIPRGLLGTLYWWSVYPFHGVVFGSMIANLAKAALAHPEPAPDPEAAAAADGALDPDPEPTLPR